MSYNASIIERLRNLQNEYNHLLAEKVKSEDTIRILRGISISNSTTALEEYLGTIMAEMSEVSELYSIAYKEYMESENIIRTNKVINSDDIINYASYEI